MADIRNPLRIAVIGSPRSGSTALSRSFGNRSDTFVFDDPFFAHRARMEGRFSGRFAAGRSADWREVVPSIMRTPLPNASSIAYLKMFADDMIGMDQPSWMQTVKPVFLIRRPWPQIDSYLKIRARLGRPKPLNKITSGTTGLPQQQEVFNLITRARGDYRPIVVRYEDLLQDPRGELLELCRALGIEFTEQMLAWKPGRRPSDLPEEITPGFYDEVVKSTGFAPASPERPCPKELGPIVRACNAIYDELSEHALGKSRQINQFASD